MISVIVNLKELLPRGDPGGDATDEAFRRETQDEFIDLVIPVRHGDGLAFHHVAIANLGHKARVHDF